MTLEDRGTAPLHGEEVRHRTVSPPLALHPDLGFWLVLGGVVLSCLAGNWQYLGVKVPIDRVLLIGGLLIEWHGAWRTGRLPSARTSGVLLIAATAWAAISFIGSPDRGIDGFYFLLDLYIIPTALFLTAPILFRTPTRRSLLAKTFTVFAIYLGFTAVTQMLGVSALVWPSYILDPGVGIHFGRARGPYVEAVANGMMLVFSGTLAAYVAYSSRTRAWRLVALVAVVLAGIGIALTLTRAVWFCGIASLLIGFVFVPGLRRRAVPVAIGIVLAAVLFLAAFPEFSQLATSRSTDQDPIYDRLNVDAAAARMIVSNPLFGVGWYEAQERMSEYIRLGASYPVTDASAVLIPHNIFLGRFAELGILGGALWVASLIGAVVLPVLRAGASALRPWRVVLLSLAACWFIAGNFGPVNYSQPTYVLYLVGGLVLSGSERFSSRHVEAEGTRA